MGGFAWVTLATNDSYSLGALVLAHSLKQVGTSHQLTVLVTPGVTTPMREKLASVFNLVQEVNILDSKDEANLRLLKRPELGITFTKLHCWKLTQYDKCVFLDADTLVLQNCDELFEREELSAAPDVGWPDCFNSGVFVYKPSNETYEKLVEFALNRGSFDGGDQGLLNLYFSDWAQKDISKHLPFIYNMSATATYSYLPAFKQFGANAKIVHFIGNTKPWLQYLDSETRQVHVSSNLYHLKEVVQQWWNIFCAVIHPALSHEMVPTRTSAVHFSPPSPSPTLSNPHPVRSNVETFNPSQDLDYKNVWDPWEEYEEKHENQNFEQLPEIEIFNPPPLVESNNPTRPIESHNTNERIISSSLGNNDESNNSIVIDKTERHSDNSPQVFDRPPRNDPPEFQPVYTSHEPINPPINSHIRPNTLPDCNPLARPHECESSCKSNESALHDDPSEAQCTEESGLAGAFARLTLGVPRSPEQNALEDHLRRQGWEVGNIDYMGRDSFDNIWSKICETLAEPVAAPAPVKEAATVPESASPQPVQAAETVAPVSEPLKPTTPTAETPVVPAPESPKVESSTPTECPILVSCPKPATPTTEAPKPATPTTEAPKPATPTTEVPKPATPTAESPKPVTPTTEVPKPSTPTTEAPKPATPTAEAQKPATPSTEVPKPATPTTEAPKPATPPTEAPKPATPTTEVPKPATPTAESPKPATPTTEAPKPATPTTAAPKPATPTTEAPKPTTPTTEAPKPATPTTEAPKPATPTTEAPKPATPTIEAPKPATPTTEAPKPVTPTSEAPKCIKEAPKPTTPTPPKPSTPTTEAPKLAASAPKAAETPKTEAAKSEAPPSPSGESGPTPPPRKADKGAKKPAKGKK